MNIEVINISKDRQRKCLYMGRAASGTHFGNPFTHLTKDTLAKVVVGSREESIQAFRDWLDGTKYQDIEPVRRLWMLARIKELAYDGGYLVLGCFCAPQSCHADVIRERILAERQALEDELEPPDTELDPYDGNGWTIEDTSER